ncbi:hypothetical protein [Bradyrhizobium sp. OAE829]|uniref:hypothetical protein n=1 Tax=Bradyrhizobium sp. OAE829 TaxID=2663807 RepID=UPI00178A0E70
MSTENPPGNDADRGSLFTDLPWLRRTLVFGLLGPLLGVFELLAYEAVLGGLGYLLSVIMGVVFVFGLLASIVTGIMDGRLSSILPVAWRAPLAALSGALLAVGPPAVLLGPMPLNSSIAVGVVGALNMAVCSLLSHDSGRGRPS